MDRQIIQIAAADKNLYALCDDGTVWVFLDAPVSGG